MMHTRQWRTAEENVDELAPSAINSSDDDDGLPPQPPSPLHLAAIGDQLDEYRTILESIQLQDTTDLSKPLAYRAHLERLVDGYWDTSVRQKAGGEGGAAASTPRNTAMGQEELSRRLKGMIRHHPFFRLSPMLLRWPLLAADVSRPAWTLGEEVVAVMEKQRRAMARQAGGGSDGQRDGVEPIESEIVLPAVITCQHALVGLLHDLARQTESRVPRQDKLSKRRDVIIGWRDVLSILSTRSNVPRPVLEATQERLHAIFGQVDYIPPSSWTSTLGMGGLDNISESLKRDDGVPSKWQRVPRQVQGRKSARALEVDMPLITSRKRARYLESPPTSSPGDKAG